MAAPNLEVYNGVSWNDAFPKVHNGTAFQAIIAGWVSQGASTWGQWKAGFGVSSCSWHVNTGTCSASTCSPQETHDVVVSLTGCNFSIHHTHIYKSENGGSFFSVGQSECSGLNGINNNHYFTKFGHSDYYEYRAEMHLDSDHSLIGSACYTGETTVLRHESCVVCTGA